MKAKIFKTEADDQSALARVESLMDAKLGSARDEEPELWSLLEAASSHASGNHSNRQGRDGLSSGDLVRYAGAVQEAVSPDHAAF